MVDFIDRNKSEFGVEPICEVLQFAPSTYRSAKTRPPSKRAVSDAMWIPILVALWKANYSVYGARKMWVAACKAGHEIGRDQIAGLMKQAGISGVSKLKRVRTTLRDDTADRPPDLVDREFTAERPNALWVTDLIGAVPSIGSVGDSYDNALAEATNSLYKAELIRGPEHQGRWRNTEDVELATLGWVHWFNTDRIHSYLDDASPDEFEAAHYAANKTDQHQVGIH